MAENLDFCRKCEAPFTGIGGNEFGLCPTCEDESLAIAEQLQGEFDELGPDCYDDEQFEDDFYGNPRTADGPWTVEPGYEGQPPIGG